MQSVSRILAASTLAMAALLIAPSTAGAQCSAKVSSTFSGKLIITDQQLDLDAGSPADVIAAIKKKNLTEVKHVAGDESPTWIFYFTAFMSRAPGATMVSVDFYTDDKEHRYAANKRLDGVDPSGKLLQGAIQLSEDDGLDANKRYQVKLTATVKNKEVVLATTALTTK